MAKSCRAFAAADVVLEFQRLRWEEFRRPFGLERGTELYEGEAEQAQYVGVFDGDADVPAALCGALFLMDRGDGNCQLHQMCIRPENRRQGVGRLLIEGAVDAARARGFATLWAYAQHDVYDFYARCGFTMLADDAPLPAGLSRQAGPVPHSYMSLALTAE